MRIVPQLCMANSRADRRDQHSALSRQHPPDAARALDPERAVAHDQGRALVDAEPAGDEPGLDGGDQSRQHAPLGHVHLDGHVDEPDADLDLQLIARLAGILRETTTPPMREPLPSEPSAAIIAPAETPR